LKNYNCKNTLTFVAAAVFFAVCMCVCFVGAYAADDGGKTADDTLKVVVENAEITAKDGVSGDCEAVFSDDTVSLNIDGFAYPNAYVQIGVSVYNEGTLTAILDEHQEFDCDIDGVSVSFPEFENGEKIESGERCDFTLVVKWDGNSQDDYTVSESGDFSLKLTYSADVADTVPDDSSSEVDESSVADEDNSSVEDSSLPDEDDSSVDDSSIPDEDDSSVADSSLPDEDDSSVADSSLPDEDDSSVADSPLTDSKITETTDSGNSPQTSAITTAQTPSDGNANTGVFTEKNALLALSVMFALCTAMSVTLLINAKKNGDETD
jgi:hypothetical protein